jgi:hypothetical protein
MLPTGIPTRQPPVSLPQEHAPQQLHHFIRPSCEGSATGVLLLATVRGTGSNGHRHHDPHRRRLHQRR